MSTVQYMATTTPSCNDYMKEPSVRDKIMLLTKPRSCSLKWTKGKPEKKLSKKDKDIVGPGTYQPFGDQAPKDYKKGRPKVITEPRQPEAFFPKANVPSVIAAAAKGTKYSACVGQYDTRLEEEKLRDKDKVKKNVVGFLVKDKRIEISSKAKGSKKDSTPGPGAYDVLPEMEFDIKPGKKRK